MFSSVDAQQSFQNFEDASLVIGQNNFTTDTNLVLSGPSYSAVSSQNVLAVVNQSSPGQSVKIWNQVPVANGINPDVTINIGTNLNGIAWSPDGNVLVAAGTSTNTLYIWNSIPTLNNQAADVVITLPGDQFVGVCITPGGQLLASSYNRNRVIVWNTIPTVDNQDFDFVIGQPNSTEYSSGTAANKLYQPWGISTSSDGKLLITEGLNHRVVVFDEMPIDYNASADMVIGQPDFLTNSPGTSSGKFNTPIAASVSPEGQVFVSEFVNRRLVIFDSIPSTFGDTATIVLGQPDFNTAEYCYPDSTPTASNFARGYNVTTDLYGRAFLSDRDLNRILVFGELPTNTADLEVSVEANGSYYCDSSIFSYNVVIKNHGPDSAINVYATSAIPSSFDLISYTIDSTAVYNSTTGAISTPFILANDSIVLEVNAQVLANGQTSITARVGINQSFAIDNNFDNNSGYSDIQILPFAAPIMPLLDDLTICKGDDITINVGSSHAIRWFNSPTAVTPIYIGNTYQINNLQTTLVLYAEAFNGCPSSAREEMTVTVIDADIDLLINRDNFILESNDADADGYQWLDCTDDFAVISGAVSQEYTVVKNGSYALEITQNGCIDTTACTNVFSVYLEEINSLLEFNPNSVILNNLTITSTENEMFEVIIYNINGQVVFQNEFEHQNVIDFSNMTSGIYMVKVINDDKQLIKKFIKY